MDLIQTKQIKKKLKTAFLPNVDTINIRQLMLDEKKWVANTTFLTYETRPPLKSHNPRFDFIPKFSRIFNIFFSLPRFSRIFNISLIPNRKCLTYL